MNTTVFAERILRARSREDGVERSIRFKIGIPYWVEHGTEARCTFEADGLNARAMEIRGIDPIDTIRNSLALVDKLLQGAQQEFELFWPDGEPYES